MIGRAMNEWDDAALRRVVDAPVGKWFLDEAVALGWWDRIGIEDGSKVCLYGFVAENHESWCDAFKRLSGRPQREWGRPDAEPHRYDALVIRFGVPRTVRAIKRRALAILLRRHPLDSRLAELRAETVET